MYSGKTNEAYYYNTFAYFIDGKELNLMDLPKSKRELILTTTKLYNKKKGLNKTEYKQWLAKYLKQEFGIKGASLKVVQHKYHYENNKLNLESHKPLFKHYRVSSYE